MVFGNCFWKDGNLEKDGVILGSGIFMKILRNYYYRFGNMICYWNGLWVIIFLYCGILGRI